MKITRIYLKNLNSLRGEFTINLDREPFASVGIFTITGPTGAGKSTILDAITLALYGRAARYDNKPNPENMMSRGTGECQAEVEFEIPKGRFRATWQMNRARGKADGKLQPVQRFVYDSQGVTLAQKSSEVDKLIEELTGLDVSRFFRSVLLAQGDFVRFLKANPDERATLLESLTGTSIYSEISMRAHTETSQREQTLKLQEKDLTNIKLLSQEEHALLVKQIVELKNEIENSALKSTKLTELIAKGKALENAFKHQTAFKTQLEALDREYIASEFDFNRLQLFRQGSLFFPLLRNLDDSFNSYHEKKLSVVQTEKNITLTKNKLRTGIAATSDLILQQKAEIEKSLLGFSQTRNDNFKKSAELSSWLETNQCDQSLDIYLSCIVEQITSLIHQRQKIKELFASQNNLLKTLESTHQTLNKLHTDKEKSLTKLNEIKLAAELIESIRHEILKGQSSDQIEAEISVCEVHLNHLTHLIEQNREIETLSSRITQLKDESTKAQKVVAEEEHWLNAAQEQLKILKANWDENRLLCSLQEERDKLVAGKSCPLCGSLDHPFATHLFHEPSELEKELQILQEEVSRKNNEFKKHLSISAKAEETLKNKQEELEKVLANIHTINALVFPFLHAHEKITKKTFESAQEIENAKIVVGQKLSDKRALLEKIADNEIKKSENQKALVKAQHEVELVQNKITMQELPLQAIIEQISTIKIVLEHAQTEMSSLETSLLKYLHPYGCTLPLDHEEKKLQTSLEIRRTTYQTNLKLSTTLKIELNTLAVDERNLELKRAALETQLDRLKQFSVVHEICFSDSTALPKHEFAAHWHKIDEANEELKRLEVTLADTQSILNERKNELAKAHMLYTESETNLSQILFETPFKTIETLRTAQLTSADCQCIQAKADKMQAQTHHLKGQLAHIENELTHLLDATTPQGDQLLEMQFEHGKLNEQINAKRSVLAVAENNLKQDENNHYLHAILLKEVEAARKRLTIWQKLADLIGSYDGKTFRKFAQGLSLDLLIKHANKHLCLLSNRYRLKRMQGEQLDLEIQDLHQASTTRPTASLSGGESFLTSLALALGLSDLAGKNVRIDSLFIDEGFGTLDPETLEIAVQALESLRSKNKTIGVISHIELLKDRIPTQISIEKCTGGISTMNFS